MIQKNGNGMNESPASLFMETLEMEKWTSFIFLTRIKIQKKNMNKKKRYWMAESKREQDKCRVSVKKMLYENCCAN